ncbi:MAG: Beta-galactosidase C-terminal domain [Acidimicrobiales bacterium]
MSYEILLNHTDDARTVQLASPGVELTTDRPVEGSLVLGCRGVAVVRRERHP